MEVALGIGVLALAAAATAAAFALHRRRRLAAILLLVLAGLVLRANLAAHWWLAEWDERFHATVARNLQDTPLRPTLVAHPLRDVGPEEWTRSRIWLHKPPLALWSMAGSLALFGENELALRVPSVLLSSGTVALTYGVAHVALGPAAAVFAGALQAWHGRTALLAGGLRATDHVDAQLGFWVALAGLCGLLGARAHAEERSGAGFGLSLACGLAVGAGVLTKSAPGLLGLGVFAVALWAVRVPLPTRLAALALAAVAAAGVAAPWTLYTAAVLPADAAYAADVSGRRLREAVEGHAGPWSYHLRTLAKHYGAAIYLPLAGFTVAALRARGPLLPLAAWWIAPVALFSLAATKLESYPLIATPAVCASVAWLCAHPATRGAGWRGRALRAAALVVVALFAREAWQAQRPLDPRPRRTAWAEELRGLGNQVRALGPGPWVVFGAPAPFDARFYARATFEPEPLDARGLETALARELVVASYGDPADTDLPEGAFVRLAPDPRVVRERAIWRALRERDAVEVWNAPDPDRLEAYLDRTLSARAHTGWPRDRDELERSQRRGYAAVLLLRAQETVPAALTPLPADVVVLPVGGRPGATAAAR